MRRSFAIVLALVLLGAACSIAEPSSPAPSETSTPTASHLPVASPTPAPLGEGTSGNRCISYLAASVADRLAWSTHVWAGYALNPDPTLAAAFDDAIFRACLANVGKSPGPATLDLLDPSVLRELADAVVAEFATPTPVPTPANYVSLTSTEWARVVEAPQSYHGDAYLLWACITQVLFSTGTDTFRGQAASARLTDWVRDGTNAFFYGDPVALLDVVEGDIVLMKVVLLGVGHGNTQSGAYVTGPAFQVDDITRKGSC